MPILLASCSAAPSATLECGIGRVNDTCTMPSPVVSPYGRTIVPPRRRVLTARRLQDLGRGVVVARRLARPRRRALAPVGRALHQAEGAVGDRLEQRRLPGSSTIRSSRSTASPSTWRARLLDEAVRARAEVLVQAAGGVQHVADVLQGQVAVGEPRRDDGLGHHADQQDALAGERADQVEEAVEQVAAEHVAGHVLGRRHPLQRRVREQLAGQQRVGQLEPERVRQVGVDLERVAEAELPVLEPGLLGEVLVEQLATP